MWRSIEREPRSSAYRLTAAVMAGCVFSAVASCAMEPEQKPTVELRLESPPSPETIPLSEDEMATLKKHPDLKPLLPGEIGIFLWSSSVKRSYCRSKGPTPAFGKGRSSVSSLCLQTSPALNCST